MSVARIGYRTYDSEGGNVGFGTTTPTHLLHLYSTNATDNGYASAGILLQNGTSNEVGIAFQTAAMGTNTWVIGINSNQPRLDISYAVQSNQIPNAGTSLTLLPDGNVGIGTTNPSVNFEIYRAAAPNTLRLKGDTGQQVGVSWSDTSAQRWALFKPTSGNDLRLWDWTSNRVHSAFQTGGNLGIGTVTPTHKLHLYSTSTTNNDYETAGILLENATTGEAGLAIRAGAIPSANIWFMGVNSNQTRLDIGYGTQASQLDDAATSVTVQTDGNVGIGTTAPSHKLHIASSSSSDNEYESAGILLENLSSNEVGLAMRTAATGANAWIMGVNSNQTRLDIGYGVQTSQIADTDAKITVLPNGNVGVGTTIPLDKLVVRVGTGEVRFGGTNGRTLSAYASGILNNFDFAAGQVFFNSDFLIPSSKKISTAGGDSGNLYVTTFDSSKSIFTDRNIYTTRSVGIGTSSPTHKLHLYSESTSNNDYESAGILLENGSAGEAALAIRAGAIPASNAWFMGVNSNQTRLDIGYGAQSTQLDDASADLTVLTDGNVGIGTTNPVQRLEVSGSNATFRISDYVSSSLAPAVEFVRGSTVFGVDANTDWRISASNNQLIFTEADTNGTNTVMVMNANGNVGIGTNNPLALLHVEGNILATGVPRMVTIDLSGQANTSFFPVIFDDAPAGHTHEFRIEMPPNVAADVYNMHSMHAIVRGGGWSDQSFKYEIFHNYYDAQERSIGGVYRGNRDFYGIVVYLRGGKQYFIITSSRTVLASTSSITVGNPGANQSTFAIKNASMSDTSGTSSNTTLMFNAITEAHGKFISHSETITGTLSATSYANLPTASTTGAGIVQLSNSTSTTSSTLAATPTAVKAAYDLAAAALSRVTGGTVQNNVVVQGTLTASNLVVLGDVTTLDTYVSQTSNVSIVNAQGTGPALYVSQTGIGLQYAVAEFYDTDVSTTTPVFKIAEGGNIGIGTTNPSHKLHIVSSSSTDNDYESAGVLLQNTTSNEVGLAMRTAATGTNAWIMGINSNQTRLDIGYGVQTSQLADADAKITILQNGNVGFATTSPAATLDVKGSAAFGDTSFGKFVFGTGMLSGQRGIEFYYDNANNYAQIQAIHQGTAYRNIALNPAGGCVGIGTTILDAKLIVHGGDLVVGNGANGGNKIFFTTDRSHKWVGVNANWLELQAHPNEGIRCFAGSTETMRLTGSGNLGIGTTNPLAKAHILHTGTGDILRVDDESTPDTTPFIINQDGNVGFGTTLPLNKLDLNGGGITAASLSLDNTSLYSRTFSATSNYPVMISVPFTNAPNAYFNTVARITATSIAGNISGNAFLDYIGVCTTWNTTASFSTIQKIQNGNVVVNGCNVMNTGGTTGTCFFQLDSSDGYGDNIRWNIDVQLFATPSSLRFQGGTITVMDPLTTVVTENALWNANSTMTLAPSSIGIGTANPTHKLHIVSSSSADNDYESAGILLQNTTSNEVGLAMRTAATGTNAWVMGINSNQTRLDIGYGVQTAQLADADAKITLLPTGEVGIGTTIPSANLHVIGREIIQNTGGSALTSSTVASAYPLLMRAAFDTLDMRSGIAFAQSTGASSGLTPGSAIGFRRTGSSSYGQMEFMVKSSATANGPLTSVMTLTGDGNVGIGTTIPQQLLDVSASNATIRISDNVSSSLAPAIELVRGSNVFGADANTDWRISASNNQLIFTKGDTNGTSNVMVMNANGNVGIGTNTPNAILHVNGAQTLGGVLNNRTSFARFQNISGSLNNNNAYIDIYDYRNSITQLDWTTQSHRIERKIDNSTQAYIEFNPVGSTSGPYSGLAFGHGGGEWMRMKADGYIGIGTTNPSYKLHIVSSSSTDNDYESAGILLQNTTSNEVGLAMRTAATGTNAWVLGVNSNQTRLDIGYGLQTSQLADADAKMTVLPGGNVGIGSTAPTSTLDVVGNVKATKLNLRNADLTNFDINLALDGTIGNTGTDRGHITWTDNGYSLNMLARNLVYRTNASGVISAERMRITNDGNIGIGTSAPSHKLHVFSSSTTDNDYESAGLFLENGNTGEAALAIRGGAIPSTSNWFLGINSNQTRLDIGYGLQASQLSDGDVKMTVLSNGNVGINNIVPREKLDVIGSPTATARFSPPNVTSSVSTLQLWGTFSNFPSDTGPRYASRISSGFSTGTWGTEYIAFGVGNNGAANDDNADPLEKMRITSTGNVGIGSLSPTATLDVNGSVRATSYVNLPTSTTSVTGIVRLNNTVTSTSTAQAATANAVKTAYDLAAGALSRTAGGTVQNNVVVQGSLTTSNLVVLGTTTTVNSYVSQTSNVSIVNASGTGPALYVSQSGIGLQYSIAEFYDTDVSATVPVFKVAEGGNVGIGTTNPRVLLDVYGNMTVGQGQLGTSNTTVGGPFMKQEPWDAAGTTHTIAYPAYCIGDNSTGTIHIHATNKSTVSPKLGTLQCMFLKQPNTNVNLFETMSQRSTGLGTFTVSASTSNILVTTDSDCSICWTSVGAY